MIAPQTLLQNRYLVISQIGQGGMGAVYVATDQRFGSTVALKETFFTDPALRRAFEREAHLLNRLRHPALPRVSDHFMEEDGQFLVMEFITGEDLWEMLKTQGGAFPLKEVLDWADQLLDALDYLHTQEPAVVHRDIKPQNLKLTTRGQIILLDFGLAKGTPAQMSQVTATGSLFGYSRSYAPLEQIQGTGTDPRSDLYSLAATLYHLMTGVTPPDALTRASAVLNGQADPLRPANEIHAQVLPAVAQVLMRALSQNSSHRPQTASAMREALREAGKQTLLAGHTTQAHGSPASTILEQDTQLMAAPQADAPTVANADDEKMGSVIAFQDATVADAVPVTSMSASHATTGSTDADSVVTQIAPATAKRSSSGRALGIAAGVVILALVGAVVYALTRQSSTPAPATQQAPTQTSVPPASESPAVEQTNTNTENQTALPADAEPADARKTTSSADKNARRAQEPNKPKEAITAPQPPEPPDGDAQTQTDPNAPPERRRRDRDNPYYDPEQIAEEKRKAAQMRKRAIREQQRAERERRRAEELQRQERNRQP